MCFFNWFFRSYSKLIILIIKRHTLRECGILAFKTPATFQNGCENAKVHQFLGENRLTILQFSVYFQKKKVAAAT